MNCMSFGYHVIRAYEYAPEAYNKNKEYHTTNKHIANPVELVKYSLKIFKWLPAGEEKVSLKALQQINDPLEIIEFWKFTGQFSYSESKQAFIPMGDTFNGTQRMKEIWDTVEANRVKKAWNKARKIITDPNGDKPALSYDFD